MEKRAHRRRWLRTTLIVIAALIVVMGTGFLIYVSDYSHTDSQTTAAIAAAANVRRSGRLTVISPDPAAAAGPLAGKGLVFYPGGKVEASAYVPLLQKIARGGVTCVLVEMPFNLAVFDANAADRAFAAAPEVHSWSVGGHSLGGAMASSYMSAHLDRVKGLVLLGAYIYGNVPASRALTIYGSEDRVLSRDKVSYTENVLVIQGGNHAQFGNYGAQKGDGTATISREAQQEQAAAAILAFLQKAG